MSLPLAPTGVSAVASSSSATITFTPDGGDVAAGVSAYLVTATDVTTPANGGQTGTEASSPVTITGLTNGDQYTFTVVAQGTDGNGPASSASNTVTPVSVPNPPTSLVVTGGDSQATVAFTPPTNNGGAAITDYTVTATDTVVSANGGQTVTGTSSPITVTGLSNGDGYTFSIYATNSVGNSVSSAISSLVTPAPSGQGSSPNPYPNALQFTVTKVLNIVQLTDEIHTATGVLATLALVLPSGASDATPDEPGTLYVLPNTIDQTAVQTAITNHVADPDYGIPQVTLDYRAVVTKVLADPSTDLSDDEVKAGVRGLIVQMQSLLNRSS